MTNRKKVNIDAIVDEIGAVAAFARRSPSGPEIVSKEGSRQTFLATLLLAPTTALAQERRTVAGGKYEVAVGWDAEPAIEGQKNAASIRIVRANTNPFEPVEDAAETLRVRIRQGAEMCEFPLRTVFGQPGYYVAHFVPTRAGDYQFTFLGAIDGDPVDELFDSATGGFRGVQPVVDVQFPVRLGEPATVAAALREAQLAARSARVLAATGLGIGILGLLASLASWRVRSGRRAPPGAVMGDEPWDPPSSSVA
jgi:hypothetical protein